MFPTEASRDLLCGHMAKNCLADKKTQKRESKVGEEKDNGLVKLLDALDPNLSLNFLVM